MRAPVLVLATAALSALSACQSTPEAYSLAGRPLHPPPLDADTRAEREAQLARARAAHERDPTDLDALIWLGRRTAYLGRYREAIAIYTRGLRDHPDEPRLLRHRGHRHITLRRFDLAIADLERAAALVRGRPDRVEADGLPNARNVPTGTLHSNVFYHLGLALYLAGRKPEAAEVYRECLAVSRNPDMLCATTHWYYMTLRRLGREREAAALLEPIHAGLDVIENVAYHRLLLMYRGELRPEEVLPGDDDAIQSATAAYGVGNWHLYHGRADEARRVFERIVQGEQWAAFGHIAAEVELGSDR